MQLTQFTDYALRVMIHVTLIEGELISIRDLADAYSLSYHHLVKVVHKLSSEGLLEAKNGKGGGVRLGVDPHSISIADIVKKTEEFHLVECFKTEGNQCVITPSCQLKPLLGQAQSAFIKVLAGKTLAEMASNKSELIRDVEA